LLKHIVKARAALIETALEKPLQYGTQISAI
jgi:hypothetical protein